MRFNYKVALYCNVNVLTKYSKSCSSLILKMNITKEVKEEEILTCAYCQSKFKNKAELSKHIDRIHTGLGLLEGNRGQW